VLEYVGGRNNAPAAFSGARFWPYNRPRSRVHGEAPALAMRA